MFIISEDVYINSVSVNEALIIAESESEKYWYIDFSNYQLIEKSKDLKPSDRLDHTFNYKRTDIDLGEEGEYRLELIVSGDKLTAVSKTVKVPETFYREYEEMRSFNNTISQVAGYGLFLFYIMFYSKVLQNKQHQE